MQIILMLLVVLVRLSVIRQVGATENVANGPESSRTVYTAWFRPFAGD
jgi:hypothetical protein